MGLGFVLSLGYWCTDFLVIQLAMAADSEFSARRVPLIAAIPKIFFPSLVILPGLIVVSVTSHMAGIGQGSVNHTTIAAAGPTLTPEEYSSLAASQISSAAPRRSSPTRHHPRQN